MASNGSKWLIINLNSSNKIQIGLPGNGLNSFVLVVVLPGKTLHKNGLIVWQEDKAGPRNI